MKTRRFGRTELSVTELGYGAMELSEMEEAQADRLLNSVLDAGINFVDTSPDYGVSEELIGRSISRRRDDYILASKCGCNVPREEDDDLRHIWTRQQVSHNIEHSLKLLKTDHLDLWQIHSATAEDVRSGDIVDAMRGIADLSDNIKTFEIGPLADDVYKEAKRRLDAVGIVANPIS